MALKITGRGLNILRGFEFNFPVIIFRDCVPDTYSRCFHAEQVNSFSPPSPKFPQTKRIIIDNCDVHFTHKWIGRNNFPMLENVVINSEPSGKMLFARFRQLTREDPYIKCNKPAVKVQLHEKYADYLDKWYEFGPNKQEMNHVSLITDDEYRDILEQIDIAEESNLSVDCPKLIFKMRPIEIPEKVIAVRYN